MIWSIVASAVAALGGAWAGAHFALRRFKEQRAHEERLVWYTETVGALVEVKFGFQQVTSALLSNRPSREVDEFRDAAIEKVRNALAKTHQARIFAQQSTLDALLDGQKKLQGKLSVSALESADAEELFERSDELAGIFGEMAKAISGDARQHLGLEPISVEK